MSESLRDQLLKAGFKSKPASAEPRQETGKSTPRRGKASGAGDARTGKPAVPDMDLARAFALRARADQAERAALQRDAEQRAREKKRRHRELGALLDGCHLNDQAAELTRHFPHGNRIRRIHVTSEQLPRLNGGELGVVHYCGRYLLVTRDVALAAGAIDPAALALLCGQQSEPAADDGVPDDLIW